MKRYSVNVHYDYCASVEVEAEDEDEAFELAREKADALPMHKLEYCDYIDSCITDINVD